MRKRSPIIIACLAAVACGGSADTAPANGAERADLELHYVANEGVLLSTNSKKVLIDALFTRPNPAYSAPPDEMLEQMYAGDAPFDGLDLVLVTHNHPDHFDPEATGKFLSSNTHAWLMAPEDAVVAMSDSFADWSSISARVLPVMLEPGNSFAHDFNGIGVTAYRTLHSGQREEPQNLMYLIEMEGWTSFHEGDSDGNPETFTNLGLGNEDIDLALVHFWFPTNLDAEAILRGILKADHVGLFHLPIRLLDDAPGTIAQIEGDYPDIFLLLDPGELRTFVK